MNLNCELNKSLIDDVLIRIRRYSYCINATFKTKLTVYNYLVLYIYHDNHVVALVKFRQV